MHFNKHITQNLPEFSGASLFLKNSTEVQSVRGNNQERYDYYCCDKRSSPTQLSMSGFTLFGEHPEAMLWHHIYGIHEPIQKMNEPISLRTRFYLIAK
jgi:hypothetical protein